MIRTSNSNDTNYLYERDFEEYRELFSKYCPPPFFLAKDSFVYRKGFAGGWMYYLFDGQVRVFASNCDGSERSLAYLKKDNIIGIDCFDQRHTAVISAQCLTDILYTPFNQDTVQLIVAERPDFAFRMLGYYSKAIRHLCFDAENQSINNLETRMANFLYLYAHNNGSDIVDMSQQDLASAINCSRSSVSRICDKFRQEGIVCSNGKGLRILDIQRIQNYCCF